MDTLKSRLSYERAQSQYDNMEPPDFYDDYDDDEDQEDDDRDDLFDDYSVVGNEDESYLQEIQADYQRFLNNLFR